MSNTKWVNFTATVPEWAVTAMAEHALRYTEEAVKQDASKGEVSDVAALAAKAYRTGKSPHRRALLKLLAHAGMASPPRWVSWQEICDGLNINGSTASGVLGALTRDLKGHLPFERENVNGIASLRMHPKMANEILKLVEADAEATLRAAGE
ncbi:hypothetical protein [Amycolatopsis sp. lyj-84]|uniref:hypothetical protein n=1 Tax=Amycolatopsis sp. lyj-84 TaxID=2789284 RepID=UPI00397A452D